MHQNSPFPDQKSKNFWGGAAPSPNSSQMEGDSLPHPPHPPIGASILGALAYGVARSGPRFKGVHGAGLHGLPPTEGLAQNPSYFFLLNANDRYLRH